jgi:hypothetical protein
MNMDNYPHIIIVEDGSLYSTGQHHSGFPRMLYDSLLHLDYNGDIPVYRGRMSKAHGQERCEVSMMLPSARQSRGERLSSASSWTRRSSMQHTSPSPPCVRATAMPIVLFLIREQEEPMWRQRLQNVTDPEGPHSHAGMAAMMKYVHYIFNLQRNTVRTAIQQHLQMTFLEQHVEGLRHENATLRSSTLPPSGQDREL